MRGLGVFDLEFRLRTAGCGSGEGRSTSECTADGCLRRAEVLYRELSRSNKKIYASRVIDDLYL